MFKDQLKPESTVEELLLILTVSDDILLIYVYVTDDS